VPFLTEKVHLPACRWNLTHFHKKCLIDADLPHRIIADLDASFADDADAMLATDALRRELRSVGDP